MEQPVNARSTIPVDPCLIYGGLGGLVLASLMPWVSVFGIGVSGIQGDGVIALILALVGAPVAFFALGGAQWARRALLVDGIAVAVLVVFEVIHISTTELASIGSGLFFAVLATVALVAGGVRLIRMPSAPAASVDASTPAATVDAPPPAPSVEEPAA